MSVQMTSQIRLIARIFNQDLKQIDAYEARHPESQPVDDFVKLVVDPRRHPDKGYVEVEMLEMGSNESVRELFTFRCYRHRYQGPIAEIDRA